MSGTIEATTWLHPVTSTETAGGLQAVDERRRLVRTLVAGDAAAIVLGFAAVLIAAAGLVGIAAEAAIAPLAAVAIGLWAIRAQGLWNGRTATVRWTELVGLTRAAAVLGAGVLLLDRVVGLSLPLAAVVLASVLAWALLVAWRSVYRSWLTLNRRQGRFTLRTVVVGTDRRALELIRLAEVHPEAGTRVVGLVGCRREADAAGHGDLWIGELADVLDVLAAAPADRIAVCATDIDPAVLATLIREEQQGGPEVVVHPGLSGIDARRITVATVANEALLHVEPATPSAVALGVKRLVDIVVAGALLLVAAPVLAIVAVLVKREDGGPVFFRQQRVGRDDAEFGMLKFRTMVVDAEARLAAMERDNQRSGPLFKLAVDPRVTRIGNFLRRTSLDELPQLINVLRGEMSLVGPRPALRREVDAFPAELHARHRVRPGITGLWQVEARDNPAFDAYQRLDLFYVDNWSLSLDLVVLLGTAEQLVMRPFASRRHGELAGAMAATDTPAFATAA